MTIKIQAHGIKTKAEISDDSNIFEVMDAISGLLQIIGYPKELMDKVLVNGEIDENEK